MKAKAQNFETRQIMHRPNYELFYYKEPKGATLVHHHDFYEMYFLLDGNVSYWVNGEIYNLKPGDILLINPMVLHRPVDNKNAVCERMVLWLEKQYLEGLSLDFPLNKCFFKDVNVLHPSASSRAELIDKLSLIIKENKNKEMGGNLYADALLLQFMVEINRLSIKLSQSKKTINEPKELISGVLEYINENYSNDITLDNIAKEFYVSKYYLSHEFSNSVGTGIYRYIILKRLLEAKRFLLNGASSKEACEKCGFKDYANFFRAFKNEYGISPKEFKDSLT